jgi:hypothetical protein
MVRIAIRLRPMDREKENFIGGEARAHSISEAISILDARLIWTDNWLKAPI